MDKSQIIQSVKKQLGFDIKGEFIKGEIQEHLINAPFSSITCWILATGVGKTRPALLKIQDRKTLIVISQILHEQNWRDEATKWNVDLTNVAFVCYNSLGNHINDNWDYIVLDKALSN